MTRNYSSQRIVPRTYQVDPSLMNKQLGRKPGGLVGGGKEAMPPGPGSCLCNIRDTITNPANYLVAWPKRRLPRYSKVNSTAPHLPLAEIAILTDPTSLDSTQSNNVTLT